MTDLSKLTVVESRAGLDKKDFSSLELTTACLDSIKKKEPTLHAFVTVLEDDALKSAKLADLQLAKLDSKSSFLNSTPLLGIPVSLKDNFSTKDARTTASSKV
jgi:aspartyl-tRNA(Asn)/glutamyl-tRNA(Gln) amidotransferase subunit A